jgi:two-component system, OmpR family, sensor kinase
MVSSLRMRLTIWYAGAFSVVLILFSLGVYYVVKRSLYERLDTSLRSTLRVVSKGVASYQPTDSPALSPAELLADPGAANQLVALLDDNGSLLSQRPQHSPLALRLPQPFHPSGSPQTFQLAESAPDADDECRGVYQKVLNTKTNVAYVVAVIASDEVLSDQLDTLQDVLTGAIALALFLAGGGGWLLAERSLAPLAAMTAAAEQISAANLGERVPIGNRRDELGRLASSFNALLSRMDSAFAQQRQFMANASHDLRTPLAVLRTSAQVGLQKNRRDEVEYREALALIEQQAARLTRIVEDMFALARADMRQLPISPGSFYLDELLAEVVRASAILGSSKGVSVTCRPTVESPFRGDEALLRRMLLNLLDNAVKFTPEGGTVELALNRVPGAYEISLCDTGPGIPPEAQPHIFDRFYRAGQASSPSHASPGGAGLGLPIARSIAELHGGELSLQSSGPDGSIFVVRLPRMGTP